MVCAVQSSVVAWLYGEQIAGPTSHTIVTSAPIGAGVLQLHDYISLSVKQTAVNEVR